MLIRFIFLSILLFLPMQFIACSDDTSAGPDLSANTVKVLIIGNSLTFYNDQPLMLSRLSKAAGRDVYVDWVTIGGASLSDHSTNAATLNAIRQLRWDYVILQGSDYSVAFPSQHSRILPAIRTLEDQIHANSTKTRIIFFMDWAMKDGVTWGSRDYTYSEFQALIRTGTVNLAYKEQMMVAPIGWSWNKVIEERSDIELFHPDKSHPSTKGSYLGACVYYSTIFRVPAEGINYHGGLPAAEARYLQEVASSTVLDDLELWNID